VDLFRDTLSTTGKIAAAFQPSLINNPLLSLSIAITVSDYYNDSASIGDQSHLLPSSTRSRFLMYSSTSSAPLESRNLADETAAVLSTDEVAIIFSFLSYDEIMYA
jgi:hypothetical protein